MSSERNDENTNISYFKKSVVKFIEERGWKKYHTPKNLIQALQIEASELSELFLFKDDKIEDVLKDKQLLSSIEDEAADVFIYLLSLLNTLRLDLTRAFDKKMLKNSSKYPKDEFNNGIYYKK